MSCKTTCRLFFILKAAETKSTTKKLPIATVTEVNRSSTSSSLWKKILQEINKTIIDRYLSLKATISSSSSSCWNGYNNFISSSGSRSYISPSSAPLLIPFLTNYYVIIRFYYYLINNNFKKNKKMEKYIHHHHNNNHINNHQQVHHQNHHQINYQQINNYHHHYNVVNKNLLNNNKSNDKDDDNDYHKDNKHHHHHRQQQHNETLYTLAIECLNRLQSNADYLKTASFNKKTNSLERTKYYLENCLNINLDDLNKLNIIHIAGTKGKGSTCAFIEMILRSMGYKTGFYSSPHLVSVRERIRINGKPISEKMFAEYFHKIYKQIELNKNNEYNLPGYFNFLTIMSYYIFLMENIDVAIIEVGIGGRFDCTNIITKPIITGITSLDYDHCKILGNTLQDIAWNKAGIFKQGIPAFIVKQPEEAIIAIKKYSNEINTPIFLVPEFESYLNSGKINLGINGMAQKLNASLAIQLSNYWLNYINNDGENFKEKFLNNFNNEFHINNNNNLNILKPISLEKYSIPLNKTKWHGRCEKINRNNNDNICYYLDSAHTIDSMDNCYKWFLNEIRNIDNDNSIFRILVFNCTGQRNSKELLMKIKELNFNLTIFTTNRLYNDNVKQIDSDHSNLTITINDENTIRNNNFIEWNKLNDLNNNSSIQLDCISDVIDKIDNLYNEQIIKKSFVILVCGSVHLVGGFINLLNQNFIDEQQSS